MRRCSQDPRPHVSVAWAQGGSYSAVQAVVPQLPAASLEWSLQVGDSLPATLPCIPFAQAQPDGLSWVQVQELKCQVGERVHTVWSASQALGM